MEQILQWAKRFWIVLWSFLSIIFCVVLFKDEGDDQHIPEIKFKTQPNPAEPQFQLKLSLNPFPTFTLTKPQHN